MLIIRTAAEIKAEVSKLPGIQAAQVEFFTKMECAYEAGRVKGYLRGKVLPVRAVRGEWNANGFDQYRAIDARIAAVGDMVRKRLEREAL